MSPSQAVAGLAIPPELSQAASDFTDRRWVFERLAEWLKAADAPRAFMLSGGPGSGKSTLAARLVQMSNGEVSDAPPPGLEPGVVAFAHFCQAQHTSSLSPLRFVESLSLQLARRFQAFAQALAQSGEQNVVIHTTQTVEIAERESQITGVNFNALHVGGLSARAAFDRVVRRPLEQIHAGGQKETVLFLVDALDEALIFDPDDNIVTLLGDLIDHAADLPASVRLLLTGRPDPRVLHATGTGPNMAVLDLVGEAPEGHSDVRAYAHRRLHALGEPGRSALADRVAKESDGNFLYARYVLDDLATDLKRSDDLGSLRLPEGLNGHYRDFLKRELGRNLERWGRRHRPVLGAVAVAHGEGLSRRQIAGITGRPDSEIADVLRSCAQYLAGPSPEGPYRIYHQSFREFLHNDPEYHVFPQEIDWAIARHFVRLYGSDWLKCADEYAWRYTAQHLAEAGSLVSTSDQQPEQANLAADLAALLSTPEFLIANFLGRPSPSPSYLPPMRGVLNGTGGLTDTADSLERAVVNLNAWFADRRSRVCFVTSGSGSGGSALAAHLLRASRGEFPSTRAPSFELGSLLVISHFCTPYGDQALTLADLAHQIGRRYHRFARALRPAVERDVSPEFALGLSLWDLEDLLDSAFVRRLRDLSERSAFELAFRRPLEELCSPDFQDGLLILVDRADLGLAPESLLDIKLPPQTRLLITARSNTPMTRLLEQALPSNALRLRLRDAMERVPEFPPASPPPTVLDERALAWLALVPGWTERLAEACSFPSGGQPLVTFLAHVVDSGTCERILMKDINGQQEWGYWMADEQRERILEQLRHSIGQLQLHTLAVDIAECAERARQARVTVPVVVGRWAELVSRTTNGLADAANWLHRKIDALIEGGDPSQALAWERTGADVGSLLGGELEWAARLGARRVEQTYRLQWEQRRLAYFVETDGPLGAFFELLHGSDELWALHFIGPGGSGKTSLLRYLAARTARTRDATVCRVDFDYIAPVEPAHFIALLLQEWSQDLYALITSLAQEAVHEPFQVRITDLIEKLTTGRALDDPLPTPDSAELDRVIRHFVDLLRGMPQPAVLVMDTCEELSHLGSGGQSEPRVQAAFALLERVHSLLPTSRAVVAGRRLLASEGYGWRVGHPASSTSPFPARPYLRLYEIDGLNRSEADAFIARRISSGFPEQLREPILSQSQVSATTQAIRRENRRQESHDVRRFNPFQLTLYLQAVEDDPSITAHDIGLRPNETYISSRIVNRLRHPETVALLPAATLLRRFDRSMLRPASSASEAEFEEAFLELEAQEWVIASHDYAVATTTLDLDRAIAVRITDYLEWQNPQGLEAAKNRLVPELGRQLRTRPLNEISVALVSAALRLSPPVLASLLWAELEERVAANQEWSWAGQLILRLLDEDDGALANETDPMGAALMESYKKARLASGWSR